MTISAAIVSVGTFTTNNPFRTNNEVHSSADWSLPLLVATSTVRDLVANPSHQPCSRKDVQLVNTDDTDEDKAEGDTYSW